MEFQAFFLISNTRLLLCIKQIFVFSLSQTKSYALENSVSSCVQPYCLFRTKHITEVDN